MALPERHDLCMDLTMDSNGTSMEPQPSSQRGVRKNILERLKLETAADHAAIEEASAILHPRLSIEGYRAYLEDTFGFYQIAEPQLARKGVWQRLELSASERFKLPLLIRDLQALGCADPSSLPVCEAPPEWPGAAEAVGAAYVLEGSTLGGKVISRHIQQRFGADIPRAFLECYGPSSGEYWRAFRSALPRFASTRELENRMISGAQATFRTFTRWLGRRRHGVS
jgi:heme oxygenase